MKRLLYIIICLFITVHTANIYAAPDENAVKAQLLGELGKKAKNDTARLNILFRLYELSSSPKEEQDYLNTLLKESETQQNNKYKLKVYLELIKIAYNNYDNIEVERLMSIIEPLALKYKDYDTYFHSKRCAIDMLMITGKYELEEKEARQMLKEAQKLQNNTGIALGSQCLASIYVFLGKRKEAAAILEENFPVTMKAGNSIHLEVGSSLISVYSQLLDYKNWLKWLKIQEKNIGDYIKENPLKRNDVDLWYLMTYIYYLDYYTQTKDLVKAQKYMNLAEKYHSRADYETVNNVYYNIRCGYFYIGEQYDKALTESDSLIALYHNIAPKPYNSVLFLKAKILTHLDRYDEALQLYKKAFTMKDSLQVVNFNIQTQQLKNDYKTNTLLLEKEKINRTRQLSLFIVLVVVIIILVCFIVHSYRINIRLKKSEKEMQGMSDDMELANTAKERFLSNISSAISIPLNEVVAGSMQLSSDSEMGIEERKELSEQINKKSAMLMNLINNILDLSRLEAGMMKYNMSDTEIVSLIGYTVNNVIEKKNLTIEYSLPEKQIIKRIDNKRLQEIITNLLVPAGNSQITLKMVSITENGATKVFIYVYNTLLATKEKTQETIIANEINRMLVENFNGRYEIHSDEPIPYVEFILY